MNRVAVEDKAPTPIDLYVPIAEKIWQSNKNKPQYSPREIAKIYGLEEEKQRIAYTRIARAHKEDENLQLLSRLCNFIGRCKSQDHEWIWAQFDNVYRDLDEETKKQYFVDVLVIWVMPLKSTRDCLSAILGVTSQSYTDLGRFLQRMIANKSSAASVAKKMTKMCIGLKSMIKNDNDGYASELEDVERLVAIEEMLVVGDLVIRIQSKNYMGLFDAAQGMWDSSIEKDSRFTPTFANDDDAADLIYNLLALFMPPKPTTTEFVAGLDAEDEEYEKDIADFEEKKKLAKLQREQGEILPEEVEDVSSEVSGDL